MKIGAFAALNQISIDTVRHYMDLSLILPEKRGGHYYFDAQCQSDYDAVHQLKAAGFTLGDIQMIFQFERIGQLTDFNKRSGYRAYFEKKQNEIEESIKNLTDQRDRLKAYFLEMDEDRQPAAQRLGVPLQALPLLRCKACGADYTLFEGQVHGGFLHSGLLNCSCDKPLIIDGGILIGEGAIREKEEASFKADYIDEYIQTTDIDYLDKLYRGMEWSKRHLSFQCAENGVIMEPGSGHGFFLRQFIDAIPRSSLYIAVDHRYDALMWLKTVIERSRPDIKLLFLCADFDALPLKDHCVDLMLDISGSSNYAFEHTDFLLNRLNGLMKQACQLHGYFIVFNKFAMHSKIQEPCRPLFIKNNLMLAISALGFEEIGTVETDPIKRGGPFEDYFVSGELVSSLIYYGMRK